MGQIPSSAQWFSVVDLSNAFFSVPVHPDSQFWFAFAFDQKRYTWTRLPQGLTSSPTYFCTALADSLSPLTLPDGTVLLQYVDDLLIASDSKEDCEKATISLLKHLCTEGHKASLSKLQFVRQKVVFLGHVVTPEGKSLSPKRIEAITTLPRPRTKKDLLSFLGMCSYCRQFIPNYSCLDRILRALSTQKELTASSPVTWTPEAEAAFTQLKVLLQSPPTLGFPDHTRSFVQFVDERSGSMTSILTQAHGNALRPVAYFSALLDPVAQGLPPCLRAVAAAERAVLASRDLVGFAPLILRVPHSVASILHEQRASHLSAARWLRYHTTLLGLPNVTVERCSTLNPATLMPLPHDGTPHTCSDILDTICTPRPDLSSTPLTNPHLVLYVDGSASRDPDTGRSHVGFAVVTDSTTMLSSPLPGNYSAQAAELVALTEACRLATGRSVNIYTDSRYAFGVVHDFGALWRYRGFLKSDGSPILNHDKVAALLEAILLPSSIAVCKCAAHTSATDTVSLGNARADAAAKSAAARPPTTLFPSIPAPPPLPLPSPTSFPCPLQPNTNSGPPVEPPSPLECGLAPTSNRASPVDCSRVWPNWHMGWTMCQKEGCVRPYKDIGSQKVSQHMLQHTVLTALPAHSTTPDDQSPFPNQELTPSQNAPSSTS